MNHWAVKYIGTPYEKGGKSRDAFDCWGFLKFVYKNDFGIELPEYPGITFQSLLKRAELIEENAQGDWTLSLLPFEGCGVAMSQNRVFHHVGIWAKADGGKVIHSWDGLGVLASSLPELRIGRGIRTIKFYRHKLWPV